MVQNEAGFWTAKAAVLLQQAGVPAKIHIASNGDHVSKPFALFLVDTPNLTPLVGDPDVDLFPEVALDSGLDPRSLRDTVVALAQSRGFSTSANPGTSLRQVLDQIGKGAGNLGLAGFNLDSFETL